MMTRANKTGLMTRKDFGCTQQRRGRLVAVNPVIEAMEPRMLLTSASGAGMSFAAARSFGVGSHPRSVAVGDFNGDGKSDLAVADTYDDTVSVLLGNGDGSFQSKVDYATGGSPYSVTVGDFNGDGKSDLAVANFYSNTVSVLLGKGDGSFQSKVDYGTGYSPISVTVGDFNGDGKSDLAVANYTNNTVSVLLGKGDGSFQSKVDYATGSFPTSVTVGDFNGDGKSDLAVGNLCSNTVSVLLGKGDGSFQSKVDYAAGVVPQAVTVGDFNGDGKSDLAVANYTNNTVSVLLGKGDGSFQDKVDYATGGSLYSVTVGDFNGDGKSDLAAANYSSNTVSVLLGKGDGSFQSKVDYGAGYSPRSVAVGDFNGDGKSDLVVANDEDSGTVSVLLNTSNSAPTGLSLSSTSIAENLPAGTVVGTLSATDPDAINTFTYSLVSGTGSTDNGSFQITNNQLTTTKVFDYETKNSYSIRVCVTDQGGLSFEKVFAISVTDVKEAPTSISLSKATVAENAGSGTVVGTLSATDPDAINTFTYTLVSGTGSTDNGSFQITNNQLTTTKVFDYETKNSYAIRVRVKDQGGLTFDKVLTIGVTDVAEPLVVNGTAGNDTMTLTLVNGKIHVVNNGVAKDYALATTPTVSIYGLAGNDKITVDIGTKGVFVDGGDGFDSIVTGAGNDTINGGLNADTIYAGAGDDVVNGNDGPDQIHGGSGNDQLFGGKGNDTLWGDDGNDSITGGLGSDLIWGGNGNDRLIANDGLGDTIHGEAGTDTLIRDSVLDKWDGVEVLA